MCCVQPLASQRHGIETETGDIEPFKFPSTPNSTLNSQHSQLFSTLAAALSNVKIARAGKQCLHFPRNSAKMTVHAGVLELADEVDSKSIASDGVRVRPPPPALPPEKAQGDFCF